MKAKCMQCGGSTKMKKMQKGGSMMGIVGMPKYSNDPRTDAGRTLKKGGSVKKYQDGGDTSITMQKISSKDPYEIAKKVNANKMLQSKKEASLKLAAAKNKLQKDTAKKYAKGGFPDLNKDGKVTQADILKGRGVIKKTGGTVKKLTKAQSGAEVSPNLKPFDSTSSKIGAGIIGSGIAGITAKAIADKIKANKAAKKVVEEKKTKESTTAKAKFGASVPVQHSPAPGRVRSSSGTGTVPVGMRKKKGGTVKK